MPKLIVKPTINFLSTDTDSQLIIRVHGIIQSINKETPLSESIAAAVFGKRSSACVRRGLCECCSGRHVTNGNQEREAG